MRPLLDAHPLCVYATGSYGRLEAFEGSDVDLFFLYDGLDRIVAFYYRDFPDHAEGFLPLFLLNDILRFWRTLTLNYEHHRLKLRQLVGEELEDKKADSALKNYKLKVSRLATCFSMVANLAAEPTPVRPETVLELCRLTPAERFERLREHGGAAAAHVDTLATIYAEFLSSVQRDGRNVLADFRDEPKRRDALRRVTAYGDEIYALIAEVAQPGRLRYLVI